jgi:voltage-gated cation channel
MVLNAVEYFNEGIEYENIVNVVNTIFVTLYGLESLFKIIGLRLHFFRDYWNIFDLLINILSIICKFFMKCINFDTNLG